MRRNQDRLLRRACNRPVRELVVSPTKGEHRVPGIPTPPSIASEAANAGAQSTGTLGSPVKCARPQPIVVCDSTCAPSTRDYSTHQSARSERRHSTRITRGILAARLYL